MPRTALRSLVAPVLGLLATGLVAGCSTGSTDDRATQADAPAASTAVDADAFPVTIDHTFGSTTIESEPARVVTLGTNDPDNLLALGVVPVGVTKISWGGNANDSTPWFDAKLTEMDAEMPAQYDDTDSIPVDDIAALAPDLILATNSGITKKQYDQLSRIAPVVAYPGDAWTTPWQVSLEMDGKALGRSTLAAEVQHETEHALADAKETFPALQGKTFIFAALDTADLSSVPFYTPEDSRPTFLSSIGMQNAPVIEQLSKAGQFYGTVSAERAADLDSDVFITYANKESDAATFTDDKLLGQIPAVKAGRMLAATDHTVALSATIPTPLSIPYALQHFVPLVDQAAAGA